MVAETGIGSQHITDGKAPIKNFQARSQFCKPCEIQNGVQKISHGLRNFRTLYEIFVGVAKPHAKSTG